MEKNCSDEAFALISHVPILESRSKITEQPSTVIDEKHQGRVSKQLYVTPFNPSLSKACQWMLTFPNITDSPIQITGIRVQI